MWKKSLRVSAEISPSLLLRAVSSSSSSGLHRFHEFSPFRSVGTTAAPKNVSPFRECSIFPVLEISFKSFCSQSKLAENFRCWNCGAGAEYTTAFMFCHTCCSIQPVDESVDYFRVFGLRREYPIDLEEVEKMYKDWQKKLHPDLVHSKSQREREYAAAQSARVIGAYYTLADPLSRAIYLAKLEGLAVDEEERITDPELLAEILEIREAVDETEDTQSLNLIRSQLQEKFQFWSNCFKVAFDMKNLEDVTSSIRRMIYYRRSIEEIVKKL